MIEPAKNYSEQEKRCDKCEWHYMNLDPKLHCYMFDKMVLGCKKEKPTFENKKSNQ